MKLPTVTGRLTPSGVTNGSNPSVFSRRAMMIAKHKESSPDASNARSSARGANVLSCSLATRSNSAIMTGLTDMPSVLLPIFPARRFCTNAAHSPRRSDRLAPPGRTRTHLSDHPIIRAPPPTPIAIPRLAELWRAILSATRGTPAPGSHREVRETLPKLRKRPARTRKTKLAGGGERTAARPAICVRPRHLLVQHAVERRPHIPCNCKRRAGHGVSAMKSLLSAATFGLLPFPLPHTADLDRRRQFANLGDSQPHPDAETTPPNGNYEDKRRMRHQAASRGPLTTL
jgi:hypothetical protein